MSEYQAEIARLQGLVLGALAQHEAAAEAAAALLRATFPAAVAEQGGLQPLAAPQQEALTNALHAAAGQLLEDAQAAGSPLMAYTLPGRRAAAVPTLLDATVWLAEQQPAAVDAALPAQLLEQIMEGASTDDCSGVFAWVDSRTPTFKSQRFDRSCRLTLLRTCNMLLKRLSKSANALLCGRVLLFLAKLLPLTERSGVNLGGAFNADNATPVEEVQEGALDSEGKLVDAAFYRTFWGLQAYFSNPPAALAGGKWAEVSRDIRRVLERFKQEKVTVGEAAPGGGSAACPRGAPAAADGDGVAGADDASSGGAGGGGGQGASVKYLSSSRLMGLQLRDATLRRHFLLQCLILMQWCEQPRQKDKTALRSRMLEDLQDLRSQVYSALAETAERGREFAAAIRHLLQWEDAWAAWKQGGCPAAPLERPPAQAPAAAASVDLTAPAPKRRKLGSDAIFGVRVGTEELDRLWNLTEDNLSALSADDRGGFKSVRQLMDPVLEEMREAAEGEDDGLLPRASRSKLYSWKALRAVARTNLQAFSQAVQKGGDLEVAARAMYPSECPPPPAPPPAPPAKEAGAGQLGGSAGAPADTTAGTAAAADAGAAADTAAGGAAEEEGAEAGASQSHSEEEEEEEEEEGELPEEGEAAEGDVGALLEDAAEAAAAAAAEQQQQQQQAEAAAEPEAAAAEPAASSGAEEGEAGAGAGAGGSEAASEGDSQEDAATGAPEPMNAE